MLRRLYLTLTGLPPTESQAARFLSDSHPLAYERLVDRLMASPEYGQHWARWWLDLVRYTDRTASWLSQEGQAFYYRDWVTDALNQDVPYDDFVRRQLATDQMEETAAEDLSALGFLALSPTYWKELKLPCEIIKVIVADEWEERVDVVSRTFLGLTAACARCHDHKFDPISMEDYYALAGVFASTRSVAKPLIDEALYQPVIEAKKKVAQLNAEVEKLRKEAKQIESKKTSDGGESEEAAENLNCGDPEIKLKRFSRGRRTMMHLWSTRCQMNHCMWFEREQRHRMVAVWSIVKSHGTCLCSFEVIRIELER